MPSRSIETEQDRELLLIFLGRQKLPITVEITAGKHRSTQQNRLQRQWMNDFASQLPEYTAEEWRGHCKLNFGVPIMRAENDAFAKVYDSVIRPLPYEQKMAVMMVPIDLPVTSKMTVKQKTAYLEAIQKFAAESGVQLTDPEALKWKGQ